MVRAAGWAPPSDKVPLKRSLKRRISDVVAMDYPDFERPDSNRRSHQCRSALWRFDFGRQMDKRFGAASQHPAITTARQRESDRAHIPVDRKMRHHPNSSVSDAFDILVMNRQFDHPHVRSDANFTVPADSGRISNSRSTGTLLTRSSKPDDSSRSACRFRVYAIG